MRTDSVRMRASSAFLRVLGSHYDLRDKQRCATSTAIPCAHGDAQRANASDKNSHLDASFLLEFSMDNVPKPPKNSGFSGSKKKTAVEFVRSLSKRNKNAFHAFIFPKKYDNIRPSRTREMGVRGEINRLGKTV